MFHLQTISTLVTPSVLKLVNTVKKVEQTNSVMKQCLTTTILSFKAIMYKKVSAKVPLFWNSQIEAPFLVTAGIASDQTKFYAVVGAIESQILARSSILSQALQTQINSVTSTNSNIRSN